MGRRDCFSERPHCPSRILTGLTGTSKKTAGITCEMRRSRMPPNLYLSGTRKYLLEEACLGTPWKSGKSDLVYLSSCSASCFPAGFLPGCCAGLDHPHIRPSIHDPPMLGGRITESAPGGQVGCMSGKWESRRVKGWPQVSVNM